MCQKDLNKHVINHKQTNDQRQRTYFDHVREIKLILEDNNSADEVNHACKKENQ